MLDGGLEMPRHGQLPGRRPHMAEAEAELRGLRKRNFCGSFAR